MSPKAKNSSQSKVLQPVSMIGSKILSDKDIELILNRNDDDSDEELACLLSSDEDEEPNIKVEKKYSENERKTRVTPLKVKLTSEYEVDKVSSPFRKHSSKMVSPIIIKRKTELKISNSPIKPLSPSTKINNVTNIAKLTEFSMSPISAVIDKIIEEEHVTPKKHKECEITPKTRRKTTKCEDRTPEPTLRVRSTRKTNPCYVYQDDDEDDFELIKPRRKTRASTQNMEVDTPTKKAKSCKSVKSEMGICITPLKSMPNEVKTPDRAAPAAVSLVKSAKRKLELTQEPMIPVTPEKIEPGTPRSLRRTLRSERNEEEPRTPHRSVRKTLLGSPRTPSLRRTVLEANTPKSELKLQKIEEDVLKTPKSVRKRLDLTPSTPHSLKKVGHGFLTPVAAERNKMPTTPSSELDIARSQLQASIIPQSLPCREKEFNNIKSFLIRKVEDGCGGCMYISGVPGTGKTATVHTVVKTLQQAASDRDIKAFEFIEVNGLRLTEPRQAYVRIWQALKNEKVTPDQALRFLEQRFCGKNKRSTILLVDELDYLCNRRQDVIYNILDWSTKQYSKLVVLTIANTMDLPERTLKGKVSSRMGLTRLVFQPYNYQQLQEIVMNRLEGNLSFHADAVQLVARKVAAVSGDARRALDICRRSTELVKGDEIVTVVHIQKALNQIFTGVRVQAIKSCSLVCQLILRAIRDEVLRTGVEETTIGLMYPQLTAICSMEGIYSPSTGQVLQLCSRLSDSGLILVEKGRGDINKKISLNVSPDDIHYALDC